jgi:hypothetical protein
MKTKQLIDKLLNLDPTGEAIIRIPEGFITDIVKYDKAEFGPVIYIGDNEQLVYDSTAPVIDIITIPNIHHYVESVMGLFPNNKSAKDIINSIDFNTVDDLGRIKTYYEQKILSAYNEIRRSQIELYTQFLKELLVIGDVFESQNGTLYYIYNNNPIDLPDLEKNVILTSGFWKMNPSEYKWTTNYTRDDLMNAYSKYIKFTSTLEEPSYDYLTVDMEDNRFRCFNLFEFVEATVNRNSDIFEKFFKLSADSIELKRYNEIIGDVYKMYVNSFFVLELAKNYENNFDAYYFSIMENQNLLGLPGPISKEEFIDKIKTDDEFAKKWGLTITERELSLEERIDIGIKKLNII